MIIKEHKAFRLPNINDINENIVREAVKDILDNACGVISHQDHLTKSVNKSLIFLLWFLKKLKSCFNGKHVVDSLLTINKFNDLCLEFSSWNSTFYICFSTPARWVYYNISSNHEKRGECNGAAITEEMHNLILSATNKFERWEKE